MRLGLILIFVAVPIIELALLIQLGSWLGFWPTMGLIVLTAIVGSYVLRQQGLETLQKVSNAVAQGEPPVEPLVDGILILVAGAFLLTPGVLTDGIGLALLVPQVRRILRRWAFDWLVRSENVRFRVFTRGGPGAQREPPRPDEGEKFRRSGPRQRPPASGPVIDGEYERLGDRTIDPKRSNRRRD